MKNFQQTCAKIRKYSGTYTVEQTAVEQTCFQCFDFSFLYCIKNKVSIILFARNLGSTYSMDFYIKVPSKFDCCWVE